MTDQCSCRGSTSTRPKPVLLLRPIYQVLNPDGLEVTLDKRVLSIYGRVDEEAPEGYSMVYREYEVGHFPEDAIVGEEGASHPAGAHVGRPDSGTWYVDPLDGTVNFSHGLPLFSVSIGLQLPGGPALGVVHAPAVGWTFVGAPGHGATRNGRPIAPSATAALDRALLVTGFPTARTARAANTPAFLAYNQVAEGLRRLGSAALDLCFVACGWLDGTWQRNLSPWDTVGGAAVLLGAGGTLTGPRRRGLRPAGRRRRGQQRPHPRRDAGRAHCPSILISFLEAAAGAALPDLAHAAGEPVLLVRGGVLVGAHPAQVQRLERPGGGGEHLVHPHHLPGLVAVAGHGVHAVVARVLLVGHRPLLALLQLRLVDAQLVRAPTTPAASAWAPAPPCAGRIRLLLVAGDHACPARCCQLTVSSASVPPLRVTIR